MAYLALKRAKEALNASSYSPIALAKYLEESNKRLLVLLKIFVALLAAYGLTSWRFINRFDESITLKDNLFPRILFNCIPLSLCILSLSKLRLGPKQRFFLGTFLYFGFIHVAAWIKVWPIALGGKSEILAYVNSANIYLIVGYFFFVCPLPNFLIPAVITALVTFIGPLIIVSKLTGDKIIFEHILNDLLFVICAVPALSLFIARIRVQLIESELNKENELRPFLGKALAKAMFEGKDEFLKKSKKPGFMLAIDVRGSTALIEKNGEEKMADFMEKYFRLLGMIVERHNGVIQKTIGDAHIIHFGLLDHDPDLSDIPGIESDLAIANERRAKTYGQSALKCIEEIVQGSQFLSDLSDLGSPLQLGAAIDYGEVELKVVGDDKNKKELDIFGTVVNRSKRLEAHTKLLLKDCDYGSSLVICSEFAYQFLNTDVKLKSHPTEKHPVRDFPNLKVLYLLEIKNKKSGSGHSEEIKEAA